MSDTNDLPFPEENGQVSIPLTFGTSESYTKKEILESAQKAIMNLADTGMTNPLDTYVKLKAIAQFVGDCIKEVTPLAITEREAYGKEDVKKHGIALVVKNAGKKFAFDHHEGWCDINDQVVAWTEKQKAIEKMMKNAIGTAGIVDDETGEVIPPAIVASEGKTTLQATIPNK